MIRKLSFFGAIAFLLMLSSCKKDDDNCPYGEPNQVAPANEVTALEVYLAASSITATRHPSGLFYNIITPGTGGTPGQTSPVGFTLGGLIAGWRIGIPLIKTGGSVRLYIPPSLAYGNQAVGNIPANSILIFDIELTNIF
jgi:FKBP-type peptidyl-prolyl cis-trans isomerase FkpA